MLNQPHSRILISKNNRRQDAGFAVIFSTLATLIVVLIIISGAALSAILEQKIAGNITRSAQAYYAAESGIEDSVYRIISNKNYQAVNNLTINAANAAINITDIGGNQKKILVNGEHASRFRNLQVLLNTGSDAVTFYYGAQVGEGGLDMGNNSAVEGSVYANGNVQGANGADITGDVWVGNAPVSPDQQNQIADADYPIGQASPIIDAAQSFTAANNGKLVKISLYLKKNGSPTNKTVRLLTDNNGSPSKTLAAAGAYGTLSAAQVSQNNYSWIDIALNTPPTIAAGAKYWIALDSSLDSGNYFTLGKNSADSYAGGTGKYSPNWSASTPVWSLTNGDFGFKTWLSATQNYLDNVNVGGDAHAATINDCAINGDAYYQTINQSTVNGNIFPGSPNPGLEELPISDANIIDWKNEAEAGGIINDSFIIDAGAVASLGPTKITGNLTVSNNAELTIIGTIYVAGNINIFNGGTVRLGENYGATSGVVVTDSQITINNNAVFYGNGDNSYILFLTTASGSSAISIANNTNAALFYASQGAINIANNATLKEATAYRIILQNGAKIIYESGLASAKFSSGAGGSWSFDGWEEVP